MFKNRDKNETKKTEQAFKGKPLKITGGQPLNEAFINKFFKVFSAEDLYNFENIYNDLESKLKKINVDPEKFMNQIREAYSRYQEYKELDPFFPMDKKAMKYVDKFIRKAVNDTYESIIKKGK
ncbi:MAG: hypothetical protein OEZ13_02490 [Spirochaetia bacterium]|nr:hypothetical protein [Spirochaetia bacterium]